MTWRARAFVGALLTITAIAPATLQADTVELSVRDGRLSLVAKNATPAQIFQAWSRAGGVLVVNAERMPAGPLTLTLNNVSEEQALDTLLREVSGYLARRRIDRTASGSVFDRIVILPTPAGAPVAASPSPAPARPGGPPPPFVTQQPPRPATPQGTMQPGGAPNGIPQGPGVTRLVGSDGQPVEDDQAGAPPPAQYTPPTQPFNGGDSRDRRAPDTPPRPDPTPQQPQQPAVPPTSAPAGVPRPGMVVPAPATPGQQPLPRGQQREP